MCSGQLGGISGQSRRACDNARTSSGVNIVFTPFIFVLNQLLLLLFAYRVKHITQVISQTRDTLTKIVNFRECGSQFCVECRNARFQICLALQQIFHVRFSFYLFPNEANTARTLRLCSAANAFALSFWTFLKSFFTRFFLASSTAGFTSIKKNFLECPSVRGTDFTPAQ